jgi:hypothetical protein
MRSGFLETSGVVPSVALAAFVLFFSCGSPDGLRYRNPGDDGFSFIVTKSTGKNKSISV